MGCSFRLPVLFALLFLSTIVLAAQEGSSPSGQTATPTFRTSADLVTIDTVVTDGDGRHVTDLTRDDFEVTVAGKRQELQQAIYIKTADQPRVLSALRASAAERGPATAVPRRSAASLALKQATCSPSASAAPSRSSWTIWACRSGARWTFAPPCTSTSTRRCSRAISSPSADGGGRRDAPAVHDGPAAPAPGGRSACSGTSAAAAAVGSFKAVDPDTGVGDVDDSEAGELRDAMASVGSFAALEYIARGVAELPGRKCIVFFSEGFSGMFADRGESGRMWRAHDPDAGPRQRRRGRRVHDRRAGLSTGGLTAEDNPQIMQTGVNGTYDAEALVRTTAANRNRSLLDSQESMQFIADQTGGLGDHEHERPEPGISHVLDDQAGYYLLGYTAPKDAPRSGWDQNRVKVRVKRPGLHVRARQGFFGPSDPNEPKGFGFDPLTAAALSPFSSRPASPCGSTSIFGHDTKQGAYVAVAPVHRHERPAVRRGPARPAHRDLPDEPARGRRQRRRARRMAPARAGRARTTRSSRRRRSAASSTASARAIKEPGAYQMRAAVRDANTNQRRDRRRSSSRCRRSEPGSSRSRACCSRASRRPMRRRPRARSGTPRPRGSPRRCCSSPRCGCSIRAPTPCTRTKSTTA